MSVISELERVKKNLKEKQLLIFDFDGVLVDSNSIKGDMFAKIYEPYGKKIENLVRNHHLSNGGMSRFEKFTYYHKNFLGKELTPVELNQICDQFSSLVVNKVVNSNEISGANDFVKNAYHEGKLCFINSATPTNELREIVIKRGLESYFTGLYGSPFSKVDNLKEILKAHSVDSNQCVFFGDALSDLKAAQYFSIDFIGVGKSIVNLLEKKKGSWFVLKNFKEYNNGA